MEGTPLANYGGFEGTYLAEILAWRDYYAPDYTNFFGGGPKTPSSLFKEKMEEGSSSTEDTGQLVKVVADPPWFNPTIRFFVQLHQNYQGQQAEKMMALRSFVRRGDKSL